MSAAPGRRETYELLAARQTIAVQKKLSQGRVAIAGLGGLGSNVALALARCGVGALKLIDFDLVDAANIHRQAYFCRHIGRAKVEALAELIAGINPWVELSLDSTRLNAGNTADKLRGWPIIIEAFDQAESKAELVNIALAELKGAKIIAASGLAGLDNANLIVSREIAPRLFICGDGLSEAAEGLGLMAPRVMVCAGHQANLAVRLIVNGDN